MAAQMGLYFAGDLLGNYPLTCEDLQASDLITEKGEWGILVKAEADPAIPILEIQGPCFKEKLPQGMKFWELGEWRADLQVWEVVTISRPNYGRIQKQTYEIFWQTPLAQYGSQTLSIICDFLKIADARVQCVRRDKDELEIVFQEGSSLASKQISISRLLTELSGMV